MIRTRFTERFGVEVPVVSAPMAFHSGSSLAAAVSLSGGLGTFGADPLQSAPVFQAHLRAVRAATDKPFGVGFITHLLPLMTHLFDAALEAQVPVVALSFAPVEPWAGRAKRAGAQVVCQVQTLELAYDALEAGADALAVQGHEAGGHTGTMGLLPFLTRVLDLAGDTPVLAAGGIGNGRALAGVLAAGADGAWVGTPLLATPEAVEVPETYKQLVVDSDGQDTVFTSLFDRVYEVPGLPWPEPVAVRMRRNPLVDAWRGREAEAAEHLEELRAQWPDLGQWLSAFDPARSPALYGQSAASVQAVRPVAEVIGSMVGEAERLLAERAGELLGTCGPRIDSQGSDRPGSAGQASGG